MSEVGAGGGPAFGAAPNLDDLAALAEAAFAALPEAVRRLTGEVLFRVEDFPPEEVLEELGLEDPFELTGLYQGVSLGHRSVLDPAPEPSMVFLYRRPLLDEWAERGDVDLAELVSHVLVHEIGHHLGLSDAQIAEIESHG
jgi:predicted Zn-dependent protease with MMP-like domain